MIIPALAHPPTLDAEPRPLAISAKLLYGVGEMPVTVLMVLSGLFIQLDLDAVGDPSIGHLSDRSRHRLGRHPAMLPRWLRMDPCFFLLFSPPLFLMILRRPRSKLSANTPV